jgi:orotidine-5'-phosphate decarboxylase
MIVVGRGITLSADPATEIQKYKIAKKPKIP